MCRDRRDFIKQALEQRNRFASSHIAYIESMKCVSMALQRFVAGDDRSASSPSPPDEKGWEVLAMGRESGGDGSWTLELLVATAGSQWCSDGNHQGIN